MNDNNQSNQSFFDGLKQMAAADTQKSYKWFVLIAVITLGVAALLVWIEEQLGALFFGFVALVMLVTMLYQRSKVQKLLKGDGGDMKYLKVHGVSVSKEELVRSLNADYQAGKLLFSRNDRKLRAFIFPQYFLFIAGPSITVIAEKKLYWAYLTVHKKNGAVTGRIISLYTDENVVPLNVPKDEDADALFQQLSANYSLWIGFDDGLDKLYRKDRAEFMKRLDEFKWYKKMPV